ncbi:Heterogeneous nuclear ribonucleoprotein [Trichinella spiralis]|uniref:Heterogeneous nuclear ribonucleoprotein n=1 Tax=Trichinella spiralis TaxID=6334 RepID=A0ABR3KYD4_TRISP
MVDNIKSEHVVRVRGLPWSSKEEDIRKFFHDCSDIIDDVDKALRHHREHMGQRYIEVFMSKRSEMEYVLQRSGKPFGLGTMENVVRLRGLPYNCSKDDVFSFFQNISDSIDDIRFGQDNSGRASGEGFVRFSNKEATERALDRHMEKIGHRYIEVFRSSMEEMDRVTRRPQHMAGKYGRSGSGRPGPYSLLDVPLQEPDFGWGDGGGRIVDHDRGYYDTAGYRGGGPGSMYNDDFFTSSPINPRGGYYDQGASFGGRMGGRGAGFALHMRGLPYKATANDIMEFFYPIKIMNVRILFDERNRPTGEADVEFQCESDALEALKKDRKTMGERYIELFINTGGGPIFGSYFTPRGGRGSLKMTDRLDDSRMMLRPEITSHRMHDMSRSIGLCPPRDLIGSEMGYSSSIYSSSMNQYVGKTLPMYGGMSESKLYE